MLRIPFRNCHLLTLILLFLFPIEVRADLKDDLVINSHGTLIQENLKSLEDVDINDPLAALTPAAAELFWLDLLSGSKSLHWAWKDFDSLGGDNETDFSSAIRDLLDSNKKMKSAAETLLPWIGKERSQSQLIRGVAYGVIAYIVELQTNNVSAVSAISTWQRKLVQLQLTPKGKLDAQEKGKYLDALQKFQLQLADYTATRKDLYMKLFVHMNGALNMLWQPESKRAENGFWFVSDKQRDTILAGFTRHFGEQIKTYRRDKEANTGAYEVVPFFITSFQDKIMSADVQSSS